MVDRKLCWHGILCAVCASMPGSLLAWGNDIIQVHGFASQGYLYSEGNNFFGESTDGSTEFYEAGLNTSIRITNRLLISGQALARNAGNTDNGSVRTDYFFLDYRMVELPSTGFGLRAGRVKNAYGFYNNTRDVIFTRPSVLLPQSAYFEGTGIRELLFSSDGLQLYGDWDHGVHSTSLDLTFGQTRELSNDVLNNLFGSSASLAGDTELRRPIFARLMHDIRGGDWRIGLSSITADLFFEPAAATPLPPLEIDVFVNVLSLQRNFEKLTITSEYTLVATDANFGPLGQASSKGEGLYLQGEYRLTPTLTLVSRYDVNYGDRERPNETDSHDLMAGVVWEPHPQWIIAADLHGIRGTAGIPEIDNPGMPLEERTELFVLMVGARF